MNTPSTTSAPQSTSFDVIPWLLCRRSYQKIRSTDAARSAPIVMLKIRRARSPRRTRCRTAPNASQGRQLGSDARTNVTPKAADWVSALLAPSWRKVAAALAHTTQDFGLIHWKAAAPRNPTGGRSPPPPAPPGGGALPGRPATTPPPRPLPPPPPPGGGG